MKSIELQHCPTKTARRRHRTGFQIRARRYLAAAAGAARSWYDGNGHWSLASRPPDTHQRFWISSALFASGQRALANAVIRKGATSRFGAIRFNIFDTNFAVFLLIRHRDELSREARAKLERLVGDGFGMRIGNRNPSFQFHGMNDNMPSLATMGLILGGEMLGNQSAVAHGLWNLQQLWNMLRRRGTISEFNSPTYTPLVIHALGAIAEYARRAEVRRLALAIEQRLWIDLAARFHPKLGVLSGPYSRAYTVDFVAHLSNVAALLWFCLGDRARPSPMQLFERNNHLVLHLGGDLPYNVAAMCWFAVGTYHIPELALSLFTKKGAYPFRVVAACEQGELRPDFPARPCTIETVLHRDFTVGTATTPFCGGELTASYLVTYRRRKKVESFRDVGTVFSRMLLNDEAPGDKSPGNASCPGETPFLYSHSNPLAFQSDVAALVLTHPHFSLAGTPPCVGVEAAKPTPISRLSEVVVFPAHFGGADEIIVGGQRRRAWSGAVKRGDWIACRRGCLLIAIRPLAYSVEFGPARITLERINRYEVIRFTFYRGQRRTFTRDGLRHMLGGFVAEHASVEEHPSLAAFAREIARAKFDDYYWVTRRVRYRRPVSPQRRPVELEISWSPGTHIPQFATINGRQVETPPLQIPRIQTQRLPIFRQAAESPKNLFVWRDFDSDWGDWPRATGN